MLAERSRSDKKNETFIYVFGLGTSGCRIRLWIGNYRNAPALQHVNVTCLGIKQDSWGCPENPYLPLWLPSPMWGSAEQCGNRFPWPNRGESLKNGILWSKYFALLWRSIIHCFSGFNSCQEGFNLHAQEQPIKSPFRESCWVKKKKLVKVSFIGSRESYTS